MQLSAFSGVAWKVLRTVAGDGRVSSELGVCNTKGYLFWGPSNKDPTFRVHFGVIRGTYFGGPSNKDPTI